MHRKLPASVPDAPLCRLEFCPSPPGEKSIAANFGRMQAGGLQTDHMIHPHSAGHPPRAPSTLQPTGIRRPSSVAPSHVDSLHPKEKSALRSAGCARKNQNRYPVLQDNLTASNAARQAVSGLQVCSIHLSTSMPSSFPLESNPLRCMEYTVCRPRCSTWCQTSSRAFRSR